MATLENKYQRGQIYTIRSHQTDQFYIGSTTQPLHKRLHSHRTHYKLWSADNTKGKCSSYEIIKNEDNYIELLEDFKCNSKGCGILTLVLKIVSQFVVNPHSFAETSSKGKQKVCVIELSTVL